MDMPEPQAHNFSWGEIGALIVGLGWSAQNAPKFWGWLARRFESDADRRAKAEQAEAERRAKIEDEISRRREKDDERLISLYDRIIAANKAEYDSRISENKETIMALREQVSSLHTLVNNLLYSVGQQEEKIDLVKQTAETANKKANIQAALSDPAVLHRIEQQAHEPL
jgi:hypothetical protein